MNENYATQEQLMELEKKMDDGFHKLTLLINELKTANDDRYLQQKDNYDQAVIRLSNPAFRAQCLSLGTEWAASREGKLALKESFCENLNTTRDTSTKWVKWVIGFASIVMAVWISSFGSSFLRVQEANVKAQEATQRALTTIIQQQAR